MCYIRRCHTLLLRALSQFVFNTKRPREAQLCFLPEEPQDMLHSLFTVTPVGVLLLLSLLPEPSAALATQLL